MSERCVDVLSFGARAAGGAVDFRLYSAAAEAVEVCLFDESGEVELRRVPLARGADAEWATIVVGIGPGQKYGYRVYGEYAPDAGRRCNAAKLLVDPYALEIAGDALWHPQLQGEAKRGIPSSIDSRSAAPKSVVVDRRFDWRGDQPVQVPWSDTLIYECHVKGLTASHPEVSPDLRGTYLGLVSAPILDHLKQLGVTTVELLPIHQAFHERHLVERGMLNYWGYSSLAFFAPDNRFASLHGDGPVAEFKEMVRRFHEAGIEVVLDVVYNHTGEGAQTGPTLSLRGIDDATYYRHDLNGSGRYVDYSGCGNTLSTHEPVVSRMILESLCYWVSEMHVDGFRFDLASALARDAQGGFTGESFVETLTQDPVLAGVKLIAEPWDIRADGYRLGRFPAGWSEWNAEYRDTVRRFWKGDRHEFGHFATRVAGSCDIFAGRKPTAGINFIACHDGFTLFDLVRYERKHNKANGEENRDGHDQNFSCNWGHEGPTRDEVIETIRARVVRAMLATLALSRGVPMLQQGDECGRSQGGNNNAYCQDNAISWVDWDLSKDARELSDFVQAAFALRRERPELRCDACYAHSDVSWRRPDGHEMTEADWHSSSRHSVAIVIHGEDGRGDMFVVFNAGLRAQHYSLPAAADDHGWSLRLDSSGVTQPVTDGVELLVPAHSVVVLVELDTQP